MSTRQILGLLNGTVIGTILGIVLLAQLGVAPSASIVIAAVAGASAASVFTGFKPIPGTVGGIAGALAGVGISLFPLPLLAIPIPSVSTYAIGGFVGGVAALSLPGLR